MKMPAVRVLLAFTLGAGVALCSMTVSITNGTMEGKICSNSNAIEFQSVPYALPPIGSLRFAPPEPYNMSFNGTYNATSITPNCLQFGSSAVAGVQSEDCLFLDVWKPENATSQSKLPVKVWVYGGSDSYGSVSQSTYNGCSLANDAIVVSINYRLGPLGWLALPSAGIAGNMGLKDILLGLRWVQDNIASFGGDSDKVVLFGESAGATNVFAISTLPQAPRLMRSAIMESGGGRYFPTVAQYQPYMESYVEKLNCSLNNLACIQSKSGDQLNITMRDSPNNRAFNSPPNVPFAASPPNNDSPGPLIDGKLITESPLKAGSQVPSIYGSNSQEGNLFLFTTYGPFRIQNLTMQDYNTFLVENFGEAAASAVNKTYPISDFAKTPLPIFYAISTIVTDSAFKCPTYRGLANTAARGVPVWTYLFNHTTSCDWTGEPTTPKFLKLLGSTHSAEIPYVFSNLEHYAFPNPKSKGNCSFNTFEKQVSQDFVNAWTAMAAHGKPEGLLNWPQFNTTTSQGINFGEDQIKVDTVDYSMCTEFWDVLDAKVLQQVTGSKGYVDPPNGSISSLAPAGPSSTSQPTKGLANKKGTGNHLLMLCLLLFVLSLS